MDSASKPWYREPWPWLLMAGPAAVVVAGAVTTALAVQSFDGLVADDYYKQGLGINRVIARESAARRLGISAMATFNDGRDRVRVLLVEGERPAALRLALVHPTLPGEDRSVPMVPVAPGLYEGALRAPHAARLRARLEDAEGRWRVNATWDTREASLRFTPDGEAR